MLGLSTDGRPAGLPARDSSSSDTVIDDDGDFDTGQVLSAYFDETTEGIKGNAGGHQRCGTAAVWPRCGLIFRSTATGTAGGHHP